MLDTTTDVAGAAPLTYMSSRSIQMTRGIFLKAPVAPYWKKGLEITF